jgi:flavin-dependent dehydrogenase
MDMNTSTQVLVIGGGPGGSTAATLLAREGFDVTLAEREVFPRYHIGESLLPSCLEVFDLLGIREKVEAQGFLKKYGGYWEWGHDSWVLDFARLPHPYGFQVIRAQFDQLLLDHAREQGVHIFEGTEIRAVRFEEGRARAASWARTGDDAAAGEIQFDYLIDASGRAGIMSTRYNKDRTFHSAFQNVGVWGYWRGAQTLEFAPPGAIANGTVPEGWLWAIPLHDGTMSVGLVTHKTAFKTRRAESPTLEDLYLRAIADCPLIAGMVRGAQLVSPIKTEQDYSYIAGRFTGPGYFVVGDAACFIDPLLSTGVHLATHAAMTCAASVASVLRGEVSEEEAVTFFERSYRRAYLRLLVIVSGLYQQYNGKDAYFWQAQQLTQDDYSRSPDIDQAFLHVVSGLEDLKDSERGDSSHDIVDRAARTAVAYPLSDASQARATYAIYRKVMYGDTTRPETGIEGMYVATQPHLGLARADASLRDREVASSEVRDGRHEQ